MISVHSSMGSAKGGSLVPLGPFRLSIVCGLGLFVIQENGVVRTKLLLVIIQKEIKLISKYKNNIKILFILWNYIDEL